MDQNQQGSGDTGGDLDDKNGNGIDVAPEAGDGRDHANAANDNVAAGAVGEVDPMNEGNALANVVEEKSVPVLNPFDLPEVVSHFCAFLPVADLKNFRLLNKMINFEACQVLRKKQKSAFRSVKDINTYSLIMNQGILHFHETFVLTDMNLLRMTPTDVNTMNTFLLRFGPRVKKCYISLNEKLALPHDWWTLLYNMPNLEELWVTICSPYFQVPLDPKDFGCTLFELIPIGGGRSASNDDIGDANHAPIPDPIPFDLQLIDDREHPIHPNPHVLRDGPRVFARRLGPPRRQNLFFGEAMGLEEMHNNWLAMGDNFESDDDDAAGENEAVAAARDTRLRRISRPVLSADEKTLYHTLVPKLCLWNLKHLHFTLTVGTNTDVSQATVNFIQTILAASHSSLTSIETDSFTTDVFLGRVILDCLKTSGFSFPRMEELNFWVKVKESDVVFLERLSHLSNMKVVLQEGIQRTTFHRLISMCCSNLRELGLVIQNLQLRCSLDMNCYLPKLQKLKLLGYKGPLLFLRHMPTLRILDLYTVECRHLMDALMNSDGLYNVQSLQELTAIKLTTVGPSSGIFLGSINSLPNLTRLELDNCDDDRMELVYKAMPNLKELIVSGTFSDVGITGIARHNCEEILAQCAHFVVEDRLVRQYLYIGNLTKLKRLSLKSDYITDLSIMFGVAKLLKLRSLTISGAQLTEIGVEVVKSYMVLEHLSMSGCPNISEAALSKLSDVWGGSIFQDEANRQRRNPNWIDLISFSHREYLPAPVPFNEVDHPERPVYERFARMRAELDRRDHNRQNLPNQIEDRILHRRRDLFLHDIEDDPELDPRNGRLLHVDHPRLAQLRARALHRARDEVLPIANNGIDVAPGNAVNVEGIDAVRAEGRDFFQAVVLEPFAFRVVDLNDGNNEDENRNVNEQELQRDRNEPDGNEEMERPE